MTADAISPSARRRGLFAAIACISVVGVSLGVTIPLLALLLERTGTPTTLIGTSTVMSAVATLIFSPFMPKLMRRFGMLPFLWGCLALAALMIACIYLVGVNVWLWFPLRFIFGIAMTGLFIGSEVWINQIAGDERRGQILGIYATGLAAGFAAGPLLLTFTGIDGPAPFIWIIVIILAAGLPLVGAFAPAAEADHGDQGSFMKLFKTNPIIFLAAAMFGAIETSIINLTPLYAIREGIGESIATLIITVFGLGTITLQVFLGRASDRFGAKQVLVFCTSVGLAVALLLPLAIASPTLLYPLLFIWGAVTVGLYTVGLIALGGQFKGALLAPANAAFVFLYAVGMLIGPPLAGAAMDLIGGVGLPAILSAFFVGYLIVLAMDGKRRAAA